MDELILTKIRKGYNTFAKIDGGDVCREAQRLQVETKTPAFRVIDKRLQALRKQGVIKYTTKDKWTANENIA